jgi:putative endonuclease
MSQVAQYGAWLRHSPHRSWPGIPVLRLSSGSSHTSVTGADGRLLQFFYVYVLRSEQDRQMYIGSTNNLKARVHLHNSGQAISTRPRRPFALIFYEAYLNESDAKRREQYFKTTKGKTALRTMLKDFLTLSAK